MPAAARLAFSALLAVSTVLHASPRTIVLPDSLCGGTDSIFADAFETGGTFASNPSLGTGGAWPGAQSRSFDGHDFGMQTYHAWLPVDYDPARAAPLMVVLHGAAGSPAQAAVQAQLLRDEWAAATTGLGYVILAPVANGPNGGWLAPPGPGEDDYDMIRYALDDALSAWNIERNRISLWGYSAGGHIAWDMVLNHDDYPRPSPLHAGNLASLATAAANSQFACYGNAATCIARFQALPRPLPVSMHIGTQDPGYAWAVADRDRMQALEWPYLSFNVFSGGHGYQPAHLAAAAAFACRFAAAP